MKVSIQGHICTVTKEPGDHKPKTSGWGGPSDPDSGLLHYVKNILNARGYDLIKKRMHKDGHLVDDLQQYLRTCKPTGKGPHIYISNGSWAIEDAVTALWRDGKVDFMVTPDVFNRQPNCQELVAKLEETYNEQLSTIDS